MTPLHQAISYIYDIEKNNYLLTRAINKIDGELSAGPQPPRIKMNKPAHPNIKEPENPQRHSTPVDKKKNRKFISCGDLAQVGVWTFVGLMHAFIKVKYNSIIDSLGYAYYIILLIFMGIGVYIRYRLDKNIRLKKEKIRQKEYENNLKEYNSTIKKYEQSLAEYNRHVSAAEKDARNNWQNRQNALNALKKQLSDKLSASKSLLKTMYSIVGIDPKYQNLVPIAYMNEFLRLGIATKFEGADGLYYLTMRELRTDEMCYKMDTIVSRLDSVINHQHSLYSELLDMNKRCDSLISQSIRETDALLAQNNLINNQNRLLAEVQNNTASAAYNSERIAREQEYMSYLQRYDRW